MCTRCPASLAIVISLGLVGAAAIGFTQPEKAKPSDKPAAAKQPEKPAAPKGDKPAADPGDMHQQEEPGPVNQRLSKLAGSWETSTKMEMQGMPPMDSKGSTTITSELGGRSLHEKGHGEFQGQTMHDFKMWCYNTNSKKYEAVWSWTMSNGYLYMTGESKDDGKTIDWKAHFAGDKGHEEFKALTTLTDNDHFTVKMFGGKMADGSQGPDMTITYTRKK